MSSYDSSGNLLVNVAVGGGGGGGGAVNITDPITPANKATVDATGALKVAATFSAASVGINDGTVTTQKAAVDASGNLAVKGAVTLSDGVIPTQKATVSQFHNVDNQSPGGTAYGILTGGVAQLLNAQGNLDRQRETGIDGVPAQGIATGAAQFAQGFSTTSATALTASGSPQPATPASMTNIQVGSVLQVDTAASQETVVVTAVTGTTFTAVFSKAHSGTWPVSGFVYNQERDAAGELDGASGKGTAVAAEYEYNGGGPGGANYDRARNLQGKGISTSAITSGGTTGSTSLVLASVSGLQPGTPLLLTGGTAPEAVYVAANYTAGNTTVPLQSAVQSAATQLTAAWDAYALQGPGLTPFLAFGEGLEVEAIYDPASGRYALTRSASSDGMSPANIPAEAIALYNAGGPLLLSGVASQLSYDRQRSFQAKSKQASVAISSGGTQGSTSMVLASVGGLMPGMPLLLGGGTAEVVYVAANYVPGQTTVPLQSPIVSGTAQTAASWDTWVLYGPSGNSMLPFGLSVGMIAIQDQNSPGNVNIPTSATADSVSGAKVLETVTGLYNGANVDRARGNIDTAAIITAVAATTVQTSADQINFNGRGIKVVVNVTAISGGSITVALQGKDAASGTYWTLLASVAVSATGPFTLTLYPGVAVTANVSASDILTRTWRVQVTPAGSTASYTVGASVIL